ncbi:hypothetical protein QYE76_032441 [Lolium multiflorum]|uniref:BTB domain-containing protein n=1 Tax=Lolium multiflorum TaxID=4521 RepID=A0AAD8QTL7_LOLMU|nr:hypothetical protein QYE76_032441 [Lolium multiflorum]
MQPAVFKAFLHFIYTDSMPSMDDLADDDKTEMVKHLLVAADKYGLERMKMICEGILCKSLDVETVAAILALADQHHCSNLKDACIEFMLSSNRIDDVVASQGANIDPLVSPADVACSIFRPSPDSSHPAWPIPLVPSVARFLSSCPADSARPARGSCVWLLLLVGPPDRFRLWLPADYSAARPISWFRPTRPLVRPADLLLLLVLPADLLLSPDLAGSARPPSISPVSCSPGSARQATPARSPGWLRSPARRTGSLSSGIGPSRRDSPGEGPSRRELALLLPIGPLFTRLCPRFTDSVYVGSPLYIDFAASSRDSARFADFVYVGPPLYIDFCGLFPRLWPRFVDSVCVGLPLHIDFRGLFTWL